MPKQLQQIRFFLSRIYRLTLNPEKQTSLVWEDMKQIHAHAGWRSGIYETEKFIETAFRIANETPGIYRYWIEEGEIHYYVEVLRNYSDNLTPDVFILASHINNLYRSGKVEIDVESSSVAYRSKSAMLLQLLYRDEHHHDLIAHQLASEDVYWAFRKLATEHEEPALIVADMLKMREEKIKNLQGNG